MIKMMIQTNNNIKKIVKALTVKQIFKSCKRESSQIRVFLFSILALISLLLGISCQTNPVKKAKQLLPSQLLTSKVVANSQYGSMPEGRTHVVIVEQWHLSPQENTRSFGNDVKLQSKLSQYENQFAIYNQVSDWVSNGMIKTVIVEGCEGEIDHNFTTRFNGWTLADLNMMNDMGMGIEHIQTHVGLKLESRFKEKLPVICGDNLSAIQEQQLMLSDLRGLMGYKSRILQYVQSPERKDSYLGSLRKVLKLSSDSSEEEVMSVLNKQIASTEEKFHQLTVKRNNYFLKAIELAAKPTAVIIGKLHSSDLSKQITDEGFSVLTFTPSGMPKE